MTSRFKFPLNEYDIVYTADDKEEPSVGSLSFIIPGIGECKKEGVRYDNREMHAGDIIKTLEKIKVADSFLNMIKTTKSIIETITKEASR